MKIRKKAVFIAQAENGYLAVMRIAVNTRFLLPGKMEGFGWYSYETLSRITRNHPEHQFIFFFDRPYDQRFVFGSNVEPVVLQPQARHPFLFWIWFEWSVTRALKKHKADVFVSPDGYLSLRSDVPSVAVIHDINFEHFPRDLNWIVRNYYRRYFPLFAAKASRIVTVSNFSRQDIISTYGINPEKIEAVHNGVNEAFVPLNPEQNASTRKKLTGGKPYFLFIGALHPRKNLARLFRAFDRFCGEKGLDHFLVIAGEKYFWNKEINDAFSGMHHKDRVVFTGHLPFSELHQTLAAAQALCFVSVFEGFGLPIVEAMRCGVPVITSTTSSMPEVAADAALLADPLSETDICNALLRIAQDESLREALIQKGNDRVKAFSWNHAAEVLWKNIERAAYAQKQI